MKSEFLVANDTHSRSCIWEPQTNAKATHWSKDNMNPLLAYLGIEDLTHTLLDECDAICNLVSAT